jgi:hypothetical protein
VVSCRFKLIANFFPCPHFLPNLNDLHLHLNGASAFPLKNLAPNFKTYNYFDFGTICLKLRNYPVISQEFPYTRN